MVSPIRTASQNNLRTMLTFFLCLVAVSYGQVTTALFQQTSSGDGTYYGGNDAGGACSIYPVPSFASNLLHVAMNAIDYDGSLACGMCLELSGSGVGSGANPIIGPFTAWVNDECPECAKGSVDLGTNGDGRWAITWKAVNCPVGSQKIYYAFQGGVNAYYVKVQVRAHTIPVQSVQIANSGSSNYVSAQRTTDNFWQCPSCTYPLVFPLNVRITSISGETLTDTIPSQSPVVNGGMGVQFSGIGSSSPPVANPTPKPVPAPQPTPKPVPISTPKPVPVPQPTPRPVPVSTPKAVPVPQPIPVASAPQGCQDTPVPYDPNTCAQQAAWGNCNADYMVGRCENTCGRCPTSCVDIPVGDGSTCAQQASWGNCNQEWMWGRCQKTCGTCSDSGARLGDNSDNGGEPNTTGIIVGSVIGGVCFLVIVGLIGFFVMKKMASQPERV